MKRKGALLKLLGLLLGLILIQGASIWIWFNFNLIQTWIAEYIYDIPDPFVITDSWSRMSSGAFCYSVLLFLIAFVLSLQENRKKVEQIKTKVRIIKFNFAWLFLIVFLGIFTFTLLRMVVLSSENIYFKFYGISSISEKISVKDISRVEFGAVVSPLYKTKGRRSRNVYVGCDYSYIIFINHTKEWNIQEKKISLKRSDRSYAFEIKDMLQKYRIPYGVMLHNYDPDCLEDKLGAFRQEIENTMLVKFDK